MGREINVGMNVKENAEAKENVKVKESEKTNIKINTTVNLAGVELRNPVMTASGTFGSGQEYGELIDLNRLGAVVTKGVANVPWPGNPTPRIAETHGGMLNAIGLQNPGIDLFCKRDIPFLRQFDTKIIVNVCGKTTEDYLEVVERQIGRASCRERV